MPGVITDGELFLDQVHQCSGRTHRPASRLVRTLLDALTRTLLRCSHQRRRWPLSRLGGRDVATYETTCDRTDDVLPAKLVLPP